jgi:hypothetical protein
MNNRVANTDIFVNKYVRQFCFFKSAGANQTAPSFDIELDGRFYRDGILNSDKEMKLTRGLA